MEKPTAPLKPLSTQEWEALIDDFQYGGGRRERWTSSSYSGLSLLELSLSTILRKDFPLNLKLHLLVFFEEYFSEAFFGRGGGDSELDAAGQILTRLVETFRVLIQAPTDGVSVTYTLKEQMMVSTSSVFITLRIDGEVLHSDYIRQLESLTELLLTVVNRPNHGPDRQTRAVACECLRELERAFPCLLSEIAGHLWGLCQSERTHAAQSYILLLTSVIHSIVMWKANVSILNTSIPMVPFSVPQFLFSGNMNGGLNKEISGSSYKELRRAMSFLLECPQLLTSCGMIEFMWMILPVAVILELQPSLLKVQFCGLLYTYDPLLCHSFLMMYLRFLDAFNGQEGEIARRLILISGEAQHYLVFRLLALHWLLGFIGLLSEVKKKQVVLSVHSRFYPAVFDPLALKSLKLDLLAYCSILLGNSTSPNAAGVLSQNGGSALPVVKLFEDGLVSVSAFKWLPPWSTETSVAFRAFHKFVIGALSHSDSDPSSTRILMESTIFNSLQAKLVELTLEFKGLVPVVVSFIERLFVCHKHCWLGECLLQTFDENLFPRVKIDYGLSSYFPIIDLIAKKDTVPPSGLLQLLMNFMIFLVEKHGPETGLKSWSQGSKVLGICRTMLMHHHTSRLFLGLFRLLAYTCLYFPDLEVRDDARIYLRMLICIPGQKLRYILNSGDQLPGIAPSPLSSSYYNVQSPQRYHDKKPWTISSYIHLERVIPLLVKQSWSLSLSTLGIGVDKPANLEDIKDSEPSVEQREPDGSSNIQIHSKIEGLDHSRNPLRMMDSKISEIIGMLRRHFSTIPDFRHMPGLKITIPCSLRFKSEPFNQIWGVDLSADSLNGPDVLPAIYAAVLTFSSSAPYGAIPSNHVPFLLGEPPEKDSALDHSNTLDIVPMEEKHREEESFKVLVTIELEPREPVPGLVDVSIEANAENGQTIRGQLQSVTVGIEDMFLRAVVSSDILEDTIPVYYLDLFNALWEACGSSTNTGYEVFPLKGGKGVAAISGTRSLKLLEVPVTSLVRAVEQYLAPFVVSVVGEPLVSIVKNGGIVKDVIWKDVPSGSAHGNDAISDTGPLYLKYMEDKDENASENQVIISKKTMGCFHILIFLPPRFHLLFQMEVCDVSTLVRIRTDHWPCLAYIDDYLEALFSK